MSTNHIIKNRNMNTYSIKRRHILSSLAIIFVLFAGCKKEEIEPVSYPPTPGEYMLPIIHTTDLHGHMVTNDDDIIHYRLAYIADKVKDIRGHGSNYNKARMLLLDGGDLYQGATVSNLQKGRPVYIAFDMMEYDAVALGNHEFDWTLDVMVDPDATLPDYEYHGSSYIGDVPVLCANPYRFGSRATCTKDYVIVEKEAIGPMGNTVKVRIGVVGFADDWSSAILATNFSIQGYSINLDYDIANRIATELERSGRCDATILLIHGSADEAANALGENTPFDLVLGGHTHWTLNGHTNWGLPYLQGGCYGESYAYAELKFTVDSTGRLSFSNVRGMDILDVDPIRNQSNYEGENADDIDEDIKTLSYEALAEAGGIFDSVVGYITVDATTDAIEGSGGRSSTMGNWMCDIYRRIGNADVAFVNSGGIRTQFQHQGQAQRNITVGDVYEIFPFDNQVYVYQLTYAELLQVFEYSMTSGGKGLFSRVTGIDCYFTSTERTSASGSIYYEYAVHSLVKDGSIIYYDSTWVDDWASRTVTVAVSNFVATTDREDTYTHQHNPLVDWIDSPRLLHDNLVDNENAIIVLQAEAGASGGYLAIDTDPHFILYDIEK